jgi:hypothetical protein
MELAHVEGYSSNGLFCFWPTLRRSVDADLSKTAMCDGPRRGCSVGAILTVFQDHRAMPGPIVTNGGKQWI